MAGAGIAGLILFVWGVAFGAAIGWALATLRGQPPRKPDTLAAAAVLDRLKQERCGAGKSMILARRNQSADGTADTRN